jgi:AcrR family transcriptional regulator
MTSAAIQVRRPREAKLTQRPARKAGRRTFTKSPDATRAGILAAAAKEFATHGFSGARVDVITAQTNTSKRMIYYYFGSKEELYRRVLQESYRALRLREGDLQLQNLEPLEALAKIVEFNFNHHLENEHFIRMVMNENVLMGRNIRQIPFIREENASVIELLGEICAKGAANGSMRPRIDPVDLHMSISALCVFNVANRHTFSYLFDRDMTGAAATAARRRSVVDLIIGGVSPAPRAGD